MCLTSNVKQTCKKKKKSREKRTVDSGCENINLGPGSYGRMVRGR